MTQKISIALFISGLIVLSIVLIGIFYVINLPLPIDEKKTNVTEEKKENFNPFYSKKIIIRNDDILDPNHLPSLRWISNLTIQKNIKMIFGIIPEPLPYNMKTINYLNKLNRTYFEFATHGYKHIRFKGLPYNVQYDMIKNGTLIIEDYLYYRPLTFIPPYDSSDINTTKALKNLEYHSITDMKYNSSYVESFISDFAYETWETDYSLPKQRSFEECKNSFNEFYNSSDEIYILCIHDWTFLDENESLNKTKTENFERVIDYYKSKPVQFMTIEDAYKWIIDKNVIKTGITEEGEYYLDLKECIYNHTIMTNPLLDWNKTLNITDKTTGEEIVSSITIEFDAKKGHMYYLKIS